METQSFVLYELVNLILDKRHFTDSREEAIAYFQEGWTVHEHQTTICIPASFVSTRETVTMTWNNNPDFEV